MVNFDLGPYFKDKVIKNLCSRKNFVSYFNESLNNVSIKKQFDVHIF